MPAAGYIGNHIVVSTLGGCSNFTGYWRRDAFFDHRLVKNWRLWPGWDATQVPPRGAADFRDAVARARSPPGRCARRTSFLHDALPRARRYLERFPAPEAIVMYAKGMTSASTPPLKGVRVVELHPHHPRSVLRHDPGRPRRRGDQGRAGRWGSHAQAERLRRRLLRLFQLATRRKREELRASTPTRRRAGSAPVKLLQSADVMIENFAPGSMSKRGSVPSIWRRSIRG